MEDEEMNFIDLCILSTKNILQVMSFHRFCDY